ncbi:hypothetical protein [Paraburkholderia terrae]|uniref:hypothetical protein n=1 Tax=Paraburkholderia terrae TaxID=311230 RepID=UPI001E3C462B|nr:hypothetical protein [Paraburkholderia terrae]
MGALAARAVWFGLFVFALASGLSLRGAGVAGRCFGLCAGIRVFAFAVRALPVDVFAFALASA